MRLLNWTLPGCLALAFVASPAAADVLKFTITNGQPAGGASHAPVWLGIHDGTFDTFDNSSSASGDVEAVAELGDTGPVTTSFTGMGPQATVAPGGPYTPGASASVNIDIADPTTNRFLSFLAMVVPSNDLFFGNDNPMAHPLFDAGGNFLGPQTITILGSQVWDAGTEVNDIADGGAFIMGGSAAGGTDENGMVMLFLNEPGAAAYQASFFGETTAAGYDITHSFTAQDVIATIEITAVPEPSTLALVGMGAVAALLFGRRAMRKR